MLRFILDTKESGFVHALSSAALTYTVTHACSIGRLKMCGCGKIPKRKLKKKIWKWGACNDNVAYGYRFSKRFTDHENMAVFRTSLEGALMVMHNNEVGRTVSWEFHYIFFIIIGCEKVVVLYIIKMNCISILHRTN